MKKKLIFLPILLLGLTVALPAAAEDFVCEPTDVTVYQGRVHVRCLEPELDGGSEIWFWAVSTANPDHANRFLTLATTALVSGRSLIFGYTAGDTSGTGFGCQADDCRTPWKISLS